eukprot:CAMPEP_0176435750 /NCGR_PEP_ID=MMETSP0127-20121128/17526_1 /TAXON_ID=938130 /ORGANISM="Platyophrya macrostoma, Strain WH" /LENGTH=56 /DNA_ID=CAMNT_0017818873 /DNA_START=84 /DNA_END=254 /DNA_ORIENTATION=-
MEADEEMRKQAELMEAKMKAGGMKKKTPLIKKEKKGFDSADYYKDKEGGDGGKGGQ